MRFRWGWRKWVTEIGIMERVARPNRQTQRRKEILDATIGLIERHDLATLRLTDVAAELGTTPNAVRYYFKDMRQLLSELALRSDVRFYDDRLGCDAVNARNSVFIENFPDCRALANQQRIERIAKRFVLASYCD